MSGQRFSDFDALEAHLRGMALSDGLIAIDGLPCSGKSTLAARLSAALDWDLMEVDDFTRPTEAWRAHALPGFPFPFLRHGELAACIGALRADRRCVYRAMDWTRDALAAEETVVERARRPLIIEGVSSLAPSLCSLYDLRIFVESDRNTVFEAIFARDGRAWEQTWRAVVMPSDDLYFATRPQDRADLIVAGRGA